MSSLEAKIVELTSQLHELTTQAIDQGDEKARKALLTAGQKVVSQTQSPIEIAFQFMFSPALYASLVSLLRSGIVTILNEADGSLSAKHLAKESGVQELLLIRLMRPITAAGVIEETGVNMYTATETSKTMMRPGILGGLECIFSASGRALAYLPDYLESVDWKLPAKPPGNFEYAFGNKSFFQWMEEHPRLANHFNNFMVGQHIHRPEWYESFPVDKILLSDKITADDTLLIDIGGGKGHVLSGFASKFPDTPGRLLLQDIPSVLADGDPDRSPRISAEAYDFFTPQPVKGARAYYLRNVLHDWTDDDCVRILQNTSGAMKPGFSKLLINEFVLPERGVSLAGAWIDLTMLSGFDSLERTRKQWETLLEKAGLEIVAVHEFGEPGENEALIEAIAKT